MQLCSDDDHLVFSDVDLKRGVHWANMEACVSKVNTAARPRQSNIDARSANRENEGRDRSNPSGSPRTKRGTHIKQKEFSALVKKLLDCSQRSPFGGRHQIEALGTAFVRLGSILGVSEQRLLTIVSGNIKCGKDALGPNAFKKKRPHRSVPPS